MTLEQACPSEYQWAQCAFKDSMTHGNSAIRITYRISLRSSSMPEPRDPLLKVLFLISQFNSDDTFRYKSFVVGPSADALQGGQSQPPAVTTSWSTGPPKQRQGVVDTGLGGRAVSDYPNSVMILPQVHLRNISCYTTWAARGTSLATQVSGELPTGYPGRTDHILSAASS
jgi:hypothetical protein